MVLDGTYSIVAERPGDVAVRGGATGAGELFSNAFEHGQLLGSEGGVRKALPRRVGRFFSSGSCYHTNVWLS
jgi:hypothetical protein